MRVGIPTEIKTDEYRVAMTPVGVEELSRTGHTVLIETGSGQGSGISDEQYAQCGAAIVPDGTAIWGRADLVVKVKEPLPEEWPLMRPGQIIFTYFHFAASEDLSPPAENRSPARASSGEGDRLGSAESGDQARLELGVAGRGSLMWGLASSASPC